MIVNHSYHAPPPPTHSPRSLWTTLKTVSHSVSTKAQARTQLPLHPFSLNSWTPWCAHKPKSEGAVSSSCCFCCFFFSPPWHTSSSLSSSSSSSPSLVRSYMWYFVSFQSFVSQFYDLSSRTYPFLLAMNETDYIDSIHNPYKYRYL